MRARIGELFFVASCLVLGCGSSHSTTHNADAQIFDAALSVDAATSVDAAAIGDASMFVDAIATDARVDDASRDAAIADGSTDAAPHQCEVPSDCVLTTLTCCGPCGAPAASDLIALPAAAVDGYHADVCEGVTTCPRCPISRNPDLFATCEDHFCIVADIALSDVVRCTTSDDCILRERECCACGTSDLHNYVSINRTKAAELDQILCGSTPACECAPMPPELLEAYCGGDGYCDIAFLE